MVLFKSSIFCKQEEKILLFGSVSGCTCLILKTTFNNTLKDDVCRLLWAVAFSGEYTYTIPGMKNSTPDTFKIC